MIKTNVEMTYTHIYIYIHIYYILIKKKNIYIYIYLRREGTKASLCAKGGALRVSLAFPGMAAFFRLRSGACWRAEWRKSSWKW